MRTVTCLMVGDLLNQEEPAEMTLQGCLLAPRTCWRDYILQLAWECPVIPRDTLGLGTDRSGPSFFAARTRKVAGK